jgi:enoyl-CoA hydratase/carnithine racemase
LVDAFYRIAQDRSNKIVILTGVGGEFIPSIDFSVLRRNPYGAAF